MPVGGVLATDGIIVPEAVSNDIGCGILFVQTDLPVELLDKETDSGTIAQALTGQIMRNIPTGFNHRKEIHEFAEPYIAALVNKHDILSEEKEEMMRGIYQATEILGTLGGGNHFIELQENIDDGTIGIMIHSGSRSIGAHIHRQFNERAKQLNEQWHIHKIAPEIHLPFLPLESNAGQEYFGWMNFALDIAKVNREVMYEIVMYELRKLIDNEIEIKLKINVHHNYADWENANGKNYLVHRKGAVRARSSDIIPIPGAMGSYSYIAKGLENADSFHSAPHGAGRQLTRTAAKDKYSTQEVMEDLKENKVILGKNDKSEVADEYKLAYKNIEDVIENSRPLVKVLKKLKTKIVIKG